MTNNPEQQGWQIPPGYYEKIGESNPNPFIHLLGRALIVPVRFAQYGRPRVLTTELFDVTREQGRFEEGNIIITPTHRSALETVFTPGVLEAQGLHHARPISKKEANMDNPVRRWGMHQLGSFAVDKKNANLAGVAHAQRRILEQGGNITSYVEGTRHYNDILTVRLPQAGAIISALNNDSLVIPLAVAGMSKEMEGAYPNRVTTARDQKAPFGRVPGKPWKKGKPVVYAFGDPFKFDKPDFELDFKKGNVADFRRSRNFLRDAQELLRTKLQALLHVAYAERGSMLEERFDS